ncbi:hypothetical protein CP533_3207 [Ophiocordyceps camponoti-saundersi (nom. inval.)]|nr:hypothetical protein CP533_3207 [Ophiocordyceps camponoti-saundersi (nom. inval.)]
MKLSTILALDLLLGLATAIPYSPQSDLDDDEGRSPRLPPLSGLPPKDELGPFLSRCHPDGRIISKCKRNLKVLEQLCPSGEPNKADCTTPVPKTAGIYCVPKDTGRCEAVEDIENKRTRVQCYDTWKKSKRSKIWVYDCELGDKASPEAIKKLDEERRGPKGKIKILSLDDKQEDKNEEQQPNKIPEPASPLPVGGEDSRGTDESPQRQQLPTFLPQCHKEGRIIHKCKWDMKIKEERLCKFSPQGVITSDLCTPAEENVNDLYCFPHFAESCEAIDQGRRVQCFDHRNKDQRSKIWVFECQVTDPLDPERIKMLEKGYNDPKTGKLKVLESGGLTAIWAWMGSLRGRKNLGIRGRLGMDTRSIQMVIWVENGKNRVTKHQNPNPNRNTNNHRKNHRNNRNNNLFCLASFLQYAINREESHLHANGIRKLRRSYAKAQMIQRKEKPVHGLSSKPNTSIVIPNSPKCDKRSKIWLFDDCHVGDPASPQYLEDLNVRRTKKTEQGKKGGPRRFLVKSKGEGVSVRPVRGQEEAIDSTSLDVNGADNGRDGDGKLSNSSPAQDGNGGDSGRGEPVITPTEANDESQGVQDTKPLQDEAGAKGQGSSLTTDQTLSHAGRIQQPGRNKGAVLRRQINQGPLLRFRCPVKKGRVAMALSPCKAMAKEKAVQILLLLPKNGEAFDDARNHAAGSKGAQRQGQARAEVDQSRSGGNDVAKDVSSPRLNGQEPPPGVEPPTFLPPRYRPSVTEAKAESAPDAAKSDVGRLGKATAVNAVTGTQDSKQMANKDTKEEKTPEKLNPAEKPTEGTESTTGGSHDNSKLVETSSGTSRLPGASTDTSTSSGSASAADAVTGQEKNEKATLENSSKDANLAVGGSPQGGLQSAGTTAATSNQSGLSQKHGSSTSSQMAPGSELKKVPAGGAEKTSPSSVVPAASAAEVTDMNKNEAIPEKEAKVLIEKSKTFGCEIQGNVFSFTNITADAAAYNWRLIIEVQGGKETKRFELCDAKDRNLVVTTVSDKSVSGSVYGRIVGRPEVSDSGISFNCFNNGAERVTIGKDGVVSSKPVDEATAKEIGVPTSICDSVAQCKEGRCEGDKCGRKVVSTATEKTPSSQLNDDGSAQSPAKAIFESKLESCSDDCFAVSTCSTAGCDVQEPRKGAASPPLSAEDIRPSVGNIVKGVSGPRAGRSTRETGEDKAGRKTSNEPQQLVGSDDGVVFQSKAKSGLGLETDDGEPCEEED